MSPASDEMDDGIEPGIDVGPSRKTAGDGHGKTVYPHLVRGIVCSILGGALWGLSGTCIKFLLDGYDISPLSITGTRMLLAGLIFLAVMLVRDRRGFLSMIRDRKALGQLAVFGIAGLFLCQLTYAISVGCTNAGTATVLQSTSVVFIMAVTCVLMRRMPRMAEIVGVILACGATWLLATGGDPTSLVLPAKGLFWGIVNGLTVVVYIMYPKRLLERFGSFRVTGTGMLMGGIVAVIVMLPSMSVVSLDASGVLALLAIIVLGTFVSFGLYMQGVKDAGAMRASMLGVSEPVMAALSSWLLLGTAFTVADLVGFAMMIAMVLIISRDEAADKT